MCCASVVLLKYREQIVVTFFVYIEYTVMAIRPVHGMCEKLAHNFYMHLSTRRTMCVVGLAICGLVWLC